MVNRYSVIATGRVQGVGFRFYANSEAIRYGLTGWVRNQEDGSVLMEIQGPASKIELFLESIKEGNRFIVVQQLVRNPIAAIIGESHFRILN